MYRPRLLLCPRNVERTQGQMDSRGRGQTYSLPFLLIYVSGRSCFLDSVFPFLASFLRRHSRVSVLCNPVAQPVILTESELCWWLLSCLKCTVNIWREIQTQIFSIYVLHSICFISYISTHIMKSKQPNISNYFGTSQILLLNKQQTSHFTKSLSNDCLKLKFT